MKQGKRSEHDHSTHDHSTWETAIREHQKTTAVLVAVGVLIGVGFAAWIMSRPAKDKVGAEDPEAPLFI